MGLISNSKLPDNKKQELIDFVHNRQESDDYRWGITMRARTWADHYCGYVDEDVIKQIASAYSFGYAHALNTFPGNLCLDELKDFLEKRIKFEEDKYEKIKTEEAFYKFITNNPYVKVDYNNWNM